jgi:hypothetical protein
MCQQQNEQNDHDQTHAAAWSIAPITAMRPRRQCTEQQQNQNYHKDGVQHFESPVKRVFIPLRRRETAPTLIRLIVRCLHIDFARVNISFDFHAGAGGVNVNDFLFALAARESNRRERRSK